MYVRQATYGAVYSVAGLQQLGDNPGRDIAGGTGDENGVGGCHGMVVVWSCARAHLENVDLTEASVRPHQAQAPYR